MLDHYTTEALQYSYSPTEFKSFANLGKIRIGSDLGFPAYRPCNGLHPSLQAVQLSASTTQTVRELDFRVRDGNG